MKVIIGDRSKISSLIADIVIEQVNAKPNSVLGFATGTSPLEVYACMAKAHQEGRVSFKSVISFNLDEYIGLNGKHIQSYRYYMDDNLFNHIDIDKKNTYVPKGVGHYKAYASKYDEKIASYGGIDLQILGIGSDGHIAFNEPGTSFDSLTHVTDLMEMTIKDNARLFKDIREVPTKAITMGIKSIMNARRIVLIATGKSKAQAIYNLINGPITEEVPCSILRRHPNCTIYVDDEAYSLVKEEKLLNGKGI